MRAVAVAVAIGVGACGGGGTPVDRFRARLDAVVSLLEANRSDVAQAAVEVRAYMSENRAAVEAEIADLERWGDEMRAAYQDDKEGGMDMLARVRAELQPLVDRVEALEETAPELMQNEDVRRALDALD